MRSGKRRDAQNPTRLDHVGVLDRRGIGFDDFRVFRTLALAVMLLGDTLWEIAAEGHGSGDIRETVHEIEQLNSLPGPVLEVGQEIAVPAR